MTGNKRARLPWPASDSSDHIHLTAWQESMTSLVETATGREFTLVRHGLSEERSTRLTGRSRHLGGRVRVLWSDYSEITEITGDRVAIANAIAGVSPVGAYYTRFASAYRCEDDYLLLIEMIR